MRIIILGLLLGLNSQLFAQYAAVEDNAEAKVTVLRDPVGFTHQPFLLLRFNPFSAFRYDNILQYGVEIAPPVGKFSFVFDYGTGKGSWALKKDVKTNYKENTSKVYRGEIRFYFSDWFPFYALDKKPFGRYYSLEYTNSSFNRVLRADLADALKYNVNDQTPYTEKRQDLRVKLGKHFHINKHLFIDLNAGIGVARYASTVLESEFTTDLKSDKIGRFSKKYVHGPNQKGFKLSSGIGLNLVVPL
jgi:hypothetical protein